ncbi:MAG: hypothetical protein U5L04_05840 [Trueperaceae bacterium]|nr:hypothetical protein [Trueperaceae bacterium]
MFRVVTTETPLGSRQRGTLSCSSEATAFIDVVNLELSENFSPTFDQVSVVGWSDTGARLLSYTLYPDGRSEQQQNPQLVSAGQSIDVSFALTFTNRDTIPSGDYNIRLELDVTPNSGGLTLLPPVPPLE